jgi:hypothetical protein
VRNCFKVCFQIKCNVYRRYTTAEIKTAHIQWAAKGSPEDNIMLEVWDVVGRCTLTPPDP